MQDRPNLIFICAHGLRLRSLGYNGDAAAYTPNIDALASGGAVMTNAVSSHPLSEPFYSSLFCSKYAVSTGAVMNGLRFTPDCPTFASVLTDAGYSADWVGKWQLYADSFSKYSSGKAVSVPNNKKDRLGFGDFFASFSGGKDMTPGKFAYCLNTDERLKSDRYEPDAITDIAVGQIKKRSDEGKPFALFVAPGIANAPFDKTNIPEEYYALFDDAEFENEPNVNSVNDIHADGWSKFAPGKFKKLNEMKRSYYAMTAWLDVNVGKIVNAVREEGIEDNTVIVFTSDCGEMFACHGRRGANTFYDEAVRVPFIIKYGGRLAGRNDTCLGTADIMPTLLGIMGIDAPDGIHGRDISPAVMSGEQIDNPSLLTGSGPAGMYGDGYEWRGIRTKKYTYAKYLIDSREYLFDNENDPYQMKNLASNKELYHIKAVLVAKMFARMGEIGDKFEKNSYYKKNVIHKRTVK